MPSPLKAIASRDNDGEREQKHMATWGFWCKAVHLEEKGKAYYDEMELDLFVCFLVALVREGLIPYAMLRQAAVDRLAMIS